MTQPDTARAADPGIAPRHSWRSWWPAFLLGLVACCGCHGAALPTSGARGFTYIVAGAGLPETTVESESRLHLLEVLRLSGAFHVQREWNEVLIFPDGVFGTRRVRADYLKVLSGEVEDPKLEGGAALVLTR